MKKIFSFFCLTFICFSFIYGAENSTNKYFHLEEFYNNEEISIKVSFDDFLVFFFVNNEKSIYYTFKNDVLINYGKSFGADDTGKICLDNKELNFIFSYEIYKENERTFIDLSWNYENSVTDASTFNQEELVKLLSLQKDSRIQNLFED